MPVAAVRRVNLAYDVIGVVGPGSPCPPAAAPAPASPGWRSASRPPGTVWSSTIGATAASPISRSTHAELHEVDLRDYDLEMSPLDEWEAKQPEIAAKFVELMRRVETAFQV